MGKKEGEQWSRVPWGCRHVTQPHEAFSSQRLLCLFLRKPPSCIQGWNMRLIQQKEPGDVIGLYDCCWIITDYLWGAYLITLWLLKTGLPFDLLYSLHQHFIVPLVPVCCLLLMYSVSTAEKSDHDRSNWNKWSNYLWPPGVWELWKEIVPIFSTDVFFFWTTFG